MIIKMLACLVGGLLVFPMSLFAAEMRVETGLSYQSWSSDASESGSQLYLPINVQSTHGRLAWELKTGYAATRGDLTGSTRQSIDGVLDTQAGATYELPLGGAMDGLVGLDVNLPTGRTGQDQRKVRIMIDPDLVAIVSPGQGVNINPTLSVARNWDLWTFGLGLGYAFQGEYDYSDQTRDYDPGDIFSMAAQVDYDFAPSWTLSLQTQYLTIGTDQVNGEDLLQKGATWLLGSALTHVKDRYQMTLLVQGLFRDKAKVLNNSGALTTESRNSQGDEWIIALQGVYQWRLQTRFSAGLQYLNLSANGYDSSSVYYMGSRRKVSLSLDWSQQITDTFDLQCSLGGFTMDDDPSWLHPDGDRRYHGWSIMTTVNQRF